MNLRLRHIGRNILATPRSLWLFTFVVVVLGMTGTLVEWFMTPATRVYGGYHGFSPDYIGYVSYIKQGSVGGWYMTFRSYPLDQPFTFIHIFYTFMGKIGGVFTFSAPLIYHLSRAILGVVLIFVTYRFYKIFLSHTNAMIGLVGAYVLTPIGWLASQNGVWNVQRLAVFPFAQNWVERITTRPHYIAGSIVFILIFEVVLRMPYKSGLYKIGAVLALLGASLSIIHPSFGILCAVVLVAILSFNTLRLKIKPIVQMHILFGLIGVIVGLGLIYWSILRQQAYGIKWLDAYVYTDMFNFESIKTTILAIGPLLWFGFIGLMWSIRKKDSNYVHVWLWIVLQLVLFVYGYKFINSDRVRFLQGLYFVPLGLGFALFIEKIRQIFHHHVAALALAICILLSVPCIVDDLKRGIGEYTDFADFSIATFPSRFMYDAYKYLNDHSPVESVVIARWEASSNLMLFSHNRVLGNTIAWPEEAGKIMDHQKDIFFTATLSEEDALKYLDSYNVQYIYYGYQEKSLGDISRYSFVHPIFENQDATIFEVKRS